MSGNDDWPSPWGAEYQMMRRDADRRLSEAIIDLCWRATPFGTNADGDIEDYLLTAGTVHRLISAAQGVGIPAAFRVPLVATDKHGCDPPCQHDIIAAAVDRLAAPGPKEATP